MQASHPSPQKKSLWGLITLEGVQLPTGTPDTPHMQTLLS